MANNRLYLQCAICGAEMVIARQLAGHDTWSPTVYAPTAQAEWLAEHTTCGPEGLTVRLSSENDKLLRLVTESM